MTKYTNEPYLRAEDLLRGGEYVRASCEIVDVLTDAPLTRRLEPVKGMALRFKGRDKVLGLGATNEALMKVIAGDSGPDTWIGKTVVLEVRRIRGPRRDENQPAIRIIPPSGTEMRSGLIRQMGESYGKGK